MPEIMTTRDVFEKSEPGGRALFMDLYQLTTAQGFWAAGLHERASVFHMFLRRHPFGGAFAVAAGLGTLLARIRALRFTRDDIDFLAQVPGNDARPMFRREFLEYLLHLEIGVDIDAVPEGTVVFAQEPLLRVTGPLLQAQLLESLVLNALNPQTLVATRAARLVLAAGEDPVVEFGMRRAQGFDGAMAASRAAFLGGCSATSNVMAGRAYGIPLRGTHGHAWVLAFGSEIEAFAAYAEALPNNCVFLVDTWDWAEGMRHAIEVGHALRSRGHELAGIRLDAGDLPQITLKARRMLDEAGFPRARIHVSNDLDEHVIASHKAQGAHVDVWGVGTRLFGGQAEASAGGVYKMGAIQDPSSPEADGQGWRHTVRHSEHAGGVSTPGVLQVRRFYDGVGEGASSRAGTASDPASAPGPLLQADCVYDLHAPPRDAWILVDPSDPTSRRVFPKDSLSEDLLLPVLRGGRPIGEVPPLNGSRARCQAQISMLPPAQRRLMKPQPFPLGLEAGLFTARTHLLLRARGIED
jgi:nicotinate phosphoribosyltransferase